MTKLYLVRHCEAVGNKNRFFQGQSDGDITENGIAQLACLSARFADINFDVMYSSDLQRAYKTALAIKGDREVDITTDKRLREINGGDWENKTWDELLTNHRDSYHTWEHYPHRHTMPNGESIKELQQRMIEVINEIIVKEEGKTVVIACHGTAIKTYLCHLHGYELKDLYKVEWSDNTAVNYIEYENGVGKVIYESDSTHLTDGLSTLATQTWWKQKLTK